MADLPPLPPGFQLDQSQGLPPLPPGFQLEQSAPHEPTQHQSEAPQQSRGLAEDVGKSAVRGTAEGVAGILGIPADIFNVMDRGFQNGVLWAAQKSGLMSSEGAENYRQHAAAYQPTELPTTENLTNLGARAAQATGTYIGPPQTTPGKYAETIGEFAPGALVGGGAGTAKGALKSIAKYGMAPAVGSETAGELTEGTPAEPYARVAGALAGAAPQAAVNALRTGVRPAAAELAQADPQQLQAAQTLLDQSRSAGAPLSVPEAVQSATGNASRVGDLQRVVDQSRKGAPIMRQFYADRPTQNEQLAQQTLTRIANPGAAPEETAANVQQAANRTVSAADKARTQAVDPYYRAAATSQVPHQEMENFLQRIETTIGQDKTGITTPALQRLRDTLIEQPGRPAIPPQPTGLLDPSGNPIMSAGQPAQPRVPITDIENLNRVRKEFRDQMAQPQWAQNAIPKEASAKMGAALDDLRGMMEQHSTAFNRGNQLYQQFSQHVNEPLLRSPTGQLAETEKFPQQAQILFNSNPLPGSQRAVAAAIRNVAASDPDAAAQLVRGHIERVFNETSQALQSGPNQAGGAKFASVLAGNNQQARNLEAAVRALPNGDTRWDALKNTLDIFRAQGTRPPSGSQTELNRIMHQELRQGSPIANTVARVGTVKQLFNVIGDLYGDFRYGRNTEQLARIFTTGNVSDLQALAKYPSRSVGARAALAAVMGERGAEQHPPDAAVQHLQQNPHLAPDFQAKYGADPSQYLNQQ